MAERHVGGRRTKPAGRGAREEAPAPRSRPAAAGAQPAAPGPAAPGRAPTCRAVPCRAPPRLCPCLPGRAGPGRPPPAPPPAQAPQKPPWRSAGPRTCSGGGPQLWPCGGSAFAGTCGRPGAVSGSSFFRTGPGVGCL